MFIFLVISIIFTCYTQEIAADCCTNYLTFYYHCGQQYNCYKYLCYDGTEATYYCGVGGCNIFGCNCAGGCRQGTPESAKRLFLEKNPNVKSAD